MAAGIGSHCVVVDTNLPSYVAIALHYGESILDFKERLCKIHREKLPHFGGISISALKVKREDQFYDLSDDDFLVFAKACEHAPKILSLYADVMSLEKPKTKEKTQKQKQRMKERKQKQKQKRHKTVKNQGSSPLDMGTVNATSGDIEISVAIEKEGNHYAYPSTPGVSAPKIVEVNNAILEEAPPIVNVNDIEILEVGNDSEDGKKQNQVAGVLISTENNLAGVTNKFSGRGRQQDILGTSIHEETLALMRAYQSREDDFSDEEAFMNSYMYESD